MQIDKQLYDEIHEYCKLNELKTRDFIHKILREAFNKEKFGDSPFAFNKKTENIVKETETTIEIKEEKNNIPKNDDKNLDLVMKVFNETLGSKISPVEPIPEPVEQVETKKEENLKPKKKRTLK
jgi:hypothetical protein